MKKEKSVLLVLLAALALSGCTFAPAEDNTPGEDDKPGTDNSVWALATNKGGLTGDINSVARGKDNFVAVDANGKIAWSANGTSWTAAAIASGITTAGLTLYDIAYGSDTFIAVGVTSGADYSQSGTILISIDDGKNWTELTKPTNLSQTRITSIAYGAPGSVPTFVAGSYDGAIAYAVKDNTVWTWTEATWTGGGSSIFTSITGDNVVASVESIVFGNGKFIAAGDKGRMAFSANGQDNWTRITNSFEEKVAPNIRGIAYNGSSLYIAVESGQAFGSIASSADGSTWMQIGKGPFGSAYNDGAYDIVYGKGKFVAAGYGGKIAYTTDGSAWTTVSDSKFGTKVIRGIAYGNNTWVAVGDDGTIAVGTGL